MCDLLTLKQTIETTSISQATIYRLIKADKFPRPVRVSARGVRWRSIDIDKWKINPEQWQQLAPNNHPTN